MNNIDNYKVNFGPQHPSAHGVMRLVLDLDGEVIKKVDAHAGLLHRSIEKFCENNLYNQNVGYMDRLDYVSMMSNEHAYVLAVEKLLRIKAPIRAEYIRTMFDEITRLLNHLLWLGAHALDIGAMAIFLYCFREREDLMDCYEAATGGRLHVAYYRPGGVYRDLPDEMPKYKGDSFSKKRLEELNYNRSGSLLDFISNFVERFPKFVDEYETLLTENRIWKQRTVGIGVVSPERAINLGFSGPMLRASGVEWDIRKKQPYAVYDKLNFKIPLGSNGDCYDRYLVRVAEMREANKIIKQCVEWLYKNPGPVMIENNKISPPLRVDMKNSMESLIHHFKYFSEGFLVPEGEVYVATEQPKGEFGIYIVSDGSNKPYRVKMRAPSYVHLSTIDEMARGHLIADLVTIIGTFDIVLGDMDR